MALSKINYPPAVLSYVQNALQIAFLGEIQFVCGALSGAPTGRGYHEELLKWGVPEAHIHTKLSTAEAAMFADRNDVACVMPGLYTETESIGWDKAHTHIVGMGGPNTRGHYRTSSASDMGNTIIHTVTANVAEVINVTGENCQFHNIHIHNEGSHANNVAALNINGYGFYGKNLTIRGATGQLAIVDADAGSLYVNGDADYATFENCTIGHNTYSYGTRDTEGSGHLVFPSTGGVQNVYFRDCYFQLRSETSTVGLVRFAAKACVGRDLIFERCLFTNFYSNYAAELATVFVYEAGQAVHTTNIVLVDCTAMGFNKWQNINQTDQISGNMPDADDGGGLTTQLSDAAAAG